MSALQHNMDSRHWTQNSDKYMRITCIYRVGQKTGPTDIICALTALNIIIQFLHRTICHNMTLICAKNY